VNDESAISRILGARVFESANVYKTGTPNVAGFVGDFSQLRYGIVEGIKMDISTEATINDGTNQINLWQRNSFAVRIEAEVGVVVKDTAAFGKLTIAAS
jgi:HK97 family phage major capsid protein